MARPTLLLNPGSGWSATSPFLYTLALDNKYCHHAHQKENFYLKLLSEPTQERIEHVRNIFIGKKQNRRKRDHPFGRVLSQSNDYVKNLDFTDFISAPYNIDKYISYYKQHYENVKHEYQAVCDFSNANFGLPLSFLQKIAPKLQEHFDVKVTMQFRDPIRRYFSEIGLLINDNPNAATNFKEKLFIKARRHRKLFFYRLESKHFSDNCKYITAYLNYSSVFGKENVLQIIMEDFWSEDQTEMLSDFLNFKITAVHENAYVPDMGKDAPKYDYLEDQWLSDIQNLNPEHVKEAMKHMKHYYSDYKNYFGSIPERWEAIS